MPTASSFRRAGGLVAVATLGMSTAVLSVAGVAQAAPVGLTTETPLTVPADICTIEFVLSGGSGGAAGSQVGGPGTEITLQMSVYPGESVTADVVTYAGGAGGTGGGDGGNGVGLLLDGGLLAVAAGGGGAGTLADGGADETAGDDVPDADVNDDVWTAGGGPGSWDTAGAGGLNGADVVSGAPGGDAVGGAGGAAGGPGAGGGGGGLFGGGAGASDGTDGAGGGGGSSDTAGGSVGTSTGPASVTYEYLACTGTDVPLAPSDLLAEGYDGVLAVSFYPEYHDSGENPDTWEYQVDGGAWTPVEPEYGYEGDLSFVVDGLTNGTPYTVHVRGVSSNGIHGASASVVGTPYLPIGAPGNVRTSVSNSVVTFTWDAPTAAGSYALDGYVGVLAFNSGESGGPVFYCENGAAERVCEAPAAPGITYEVFVTAIDAEGNAGETAGPIAVGKVAPPATVPTSNGPLQAPANTAAGVGQGEKITISGSGYAPDSLVTILIYSEPHVLTTVMTDGSGSFTVEVTVPAGLAAGQHTLVAAGVDPNGVLRYMTLPVTVTAAGPVLAFTGADIALPAFGGLAALAVGGGLLFAGRRRPVATTVEQ